MKNSSKIIKLICLNRAPASFIGVLVLLLLSFTGCGIFNGKQQTSKTVIVYPTPPEPARFQYLTKITSSSDIGMKQSSFSKMVVGEQKPKVLVKPYGIAFGKGIMFVCDNYGGGMEKIDFENKKFEFFQPQGKGQLKIPINCFIDEKGLLYIADVGRMEIVVLDQTGNYIKSFGEKNKFKPTDVFVSHDTIFVANLAENKINVFNNDSVPKLLYSFPDENSVPGSALGLPTNITMRNGKFYAADFGLSMIKIFNPSGELLDTVGCQGDRPGTFSKLKGIAVDKDDNIFAVDAAFENVQIFNKNGKLLMDLGEHYNGPGGLMIPAKIIIDYDNLKYFQKYVDPKYNLNYLVIVTSQYGPDLINVYGRIELK